MNFFYEFSFFFFFLLKFFNFLIFFKNVSFFQKFVKINKQLLFFFKVSHLNYKNKYDKNKYDGLKINFKLDFYNNIDNIDFIVINKYNFQNKNIQNQLFDVFFLFNYSIFNSKFKYYHDYKFFYVCNHKNKIIVIHSVKFLARWKDAYDLIFNIFYYNFNPLIFGSPFFKNQILSLNWNYNNFEVNIWKYYFSFFIFKLNNFSSKSDFFYSKLRDLNINFFFVTDCFYHFKNLHYFKRHDYYTVGLININISPWLISYPIISFFDNFLIQLFFIKLLIYLQKQVLLIKYKFFLKIWTQNFIFNKFK